MGARPLGLVDLESGAEAEGQGGSSTPTVCSPEALNTGLEEAGPRQQARGSSEGLFSQEEGGSGRKLSFLGDFLVVSVLALEHMDPEPSAPRPLSSNRSWLCLPLHFSVASEGLALWRLAPRRPTPGLQFRQPRIILGTAAHVHTGNGGLWAALGRGQEGTSQWRSAPPPHLEQLPERSHVAAVVCSQGAGE